MLFHIQLKHLKNYQKRSIHFDGKDYYIILPYKYEKINHDYTGNVVALDPGVRTFQTTYNNKGCVEELCKGDSVSMDINIDRFLVKRNKKITKQESKKDYQKKRKKLTWRINQTKIYKMNFIIN